MALTLVDVGADEILKGYFNNVFPASHDLTLKLFVNDITPVDTHTASDYTEASGGGYSAKTLTAGSWTINTANDPSDAVYAQQTWTFTGQLSGGATIYGYYVVNANGVLIWAERLPYPFTPYANGDQLRVTPKFQLSKGTPS